jgi:hypothetical protein
MKDAFLNTTTRNVHWLKKAHDVNELSMRPPFQRNPVWVDRQKSFLIDTILSGLPIPEVYMQDTITADGEARYIVVDGQQRIRAVLEFLEGRFSIDQKDSPEWADMFFDDLSPDEKKQIYQYNFIVRQLPDMEDVKLREIFQRLNRNVVSLNKQELRQATYWGPFIELMNEISNWDEWADINLFSPNDIRRMLDSEYVSELSIAILNGHQNKKAKLDHYYEIYEEEFDDAKLLKRIFKKVLDEVVQILPNISKSRWSKKTDFYTLFLVFAKYYKQLPLPADTRQTVQQKLTKFGEDINIFVKADEEAKKDLPKLIKDYGSGIRASTDLGSRRRRFEALESTLNNEFVAVD